jgi:hypothetical protein
MRCRQLAFIGLLAAVLILAGCAKAECKKDADCQKPHFTGQCVDKKCVWTPIPGECGNLKCESGENECKCSDDCGECAGKSGKYLVKQCSPEDECAEDIPVTSQKPITMTRELSTAGTKISVTSSFPQPFNLKKDQLELEFEINVLSPSMSELKVTKIELTATTPDKRTVSLADKSIDKHLYEGSRIKEHLILGYPTNEVDGEFTNLNLKLYLDYVVASGTTVTSKSVTLTHPYQALKFAWAKPAGMSSCPEKCDDGNPGTDDKVTRTADGCFCEFKPKTGACGNGICDAAENKCTCASDCGPCAGSTNYLVRSCVGTNCLSQLKPGITAQKQSIFDERSLGAFELQNSYKFNKPFNTRADALAIEFTLYTKQDSVSSVKFKDARLLDGTQEIAAASIGKVLTTAGQKESATISIPAVQGEQERTVTLRVWYEYVKDGTTEQGDFSKSLGKLQIISPDV